MSHLNETALLRAGDLKERREKLLAQHMDAKIHLAIIECELKQVERAHQAQIQATFGGDIEVRIACADEITGGE